MKRAKKVTLILAKPQSGPAQRAKDHFVKYLTEMGHAYLDLGGKTQAKSMQGDALASSSVRCAIAFGGDGTLLRLVHKLPHKSGCPVLGVHLGTVGFLTNVEPEYLRQVYEALLVGEHSEEARALFSVTLVRAGKRIPCGAVLNDAVITKDAGTTMLNLSVYFRSEILSQVRGDGYIVSTPTGSTAYALSAGGSILHPSLEAALLIAICPHALRLRPVVVPYHDPLSVHVNAFLGKAYLVLDGMIHGELLAQDVVEVQFKNEFLRLVGGWGSQGKSEPMWAETLRHKLKLS